MPDANAAIEVLLVEDNPSAAELCIGALRKNNLANQLLGVKDGAEAPDFRLHTGAYAGRARNHGPKVVLLDLRLPKIDGVEVLRRVRADERTKTIPIVVLTSSKEDRDIVEAYHPGANSYINKPVEFDDFVSTVAQLGLYWLVANKPPL